jgi:hypothetical protein
MSGSPAPPGITFFVAVIHLRESGTSLARTEFTRTRVRIMPPDATNYWMTETNKMKQDR